MSADMNRVLLWCVPRTVSTAFARCLSSVDGIQVVNEPYQCAFRAGPERKYLKPYLNNYPLGKRFIEVHNRTQTDGKELSGFDKDVCTYAWIRDELLGASYEDKKILFCKDMALYLDAKYHMLPSNFKHSFLIRHPAKVMLSWTKALRKTFGEAYAQQMSDFRELPDFMFPSGYGFKELYELVEFVEKNLGQQPVIVDADDLLADPPGILSAYCHNMGIPYSPDLLSWEAGDAITETWISSKTLAGFNQIGGCFNKALQSTGFGRPQPPPALESLPADVRAYAEASMGYYEKLRERRIRSLSTS